MLFLLKEFVRKMSSKRLGTMNKKGVELEYLFWWIVAIAVLVIVVLGYFIASQKGLGAIDYIKNLFRFGN
jgi:hypothetical protein